MKKLSDKAKIELLAKTVVFAINHLDGTGTVMNMKTGECEGHWCRVFAKRLRQCGFEIDDDAITYARTKPSYRKGPEWKALVEKLKKRGFKLPGGREMK